MPATSIFISAASSGTSGIAYSRISVLLGPVRTAASTFSATVTSPFWSPPACYTLDGPGAICRPPCLYSDRRTRTDQAVTDYSTALAQWLAGTDASGERAAARKSARAGFITRSPAQHAALERV